MRTATLKKMAVSEKVAKKRAWGKPRQKEKIAIIDRIELMEVDEPTKDWTPNVDSRPKTREIDLQHPELLGTETMVEILSEMRVLIPVYPDGQPSRERLIYLFRKHVTPRPQRTRERGRGWSRKRRRLGDDGMMEVDGSSWDDWTGNSDGGPMRQRKRKLEDAVTSPPKRPVDVACTSFSKISVRDETTPTPDQTTPTSDQPTPTSNQAAPTQERSAPRVIKIRRPRKEVGVGEGRVSASSGALNSDIVNGKSRPPVAQDSSTDVSQNPTHREKITWP